MEARPTPARRPPLPSPRTASVVPTRKPVRVTNPGNPWPLFFTTLRNIIGSRLKTPLLLLFLLLPVAVSFIVQASSGGLRSVQPSSVFGIPTGALSGGRALFQEVLFYVFFPFLIPIVTAAYATAAIGEEVEGKTLPYLFTRPIYRHWILIAKTLGFLLGVYAMVVVALTAFWAFSTGLTEGLFDHFGELVAFYGLAALSVFATGCVFLLLGVLLKRAIIVVGLYLFFWETLLSLVTFAQAQKLSFIYYERAIMRGITDRHNDDLVRFGLGEMDPGAAVAVLLVLGLGAFVASLFVVSKKDYNV